MPKRSYSSYTTFTSPTPGVKRSRTNYARKTYARVKVVRAAGRVRTGGYYGRFAGRGKELKFFDTALNFSIDTTGEVPATGQLNLIPQGVTESTRVGRKATIKSIQIRGELAYNPSTGTGGATLVSIMLVQDTQCNGAAAAVTDVLTANTMATALTNLENSDRFKILKQWRVPINTGAGAAAAFASVVKNWSYYKRCSIPIDFDSTASTGAIGTIRSNNLFLLAGADSLSDDAVAVGGTCRLRFSDD